MKLPEIRHWKNIGERAPRSERGIAHLQQEFLSNTEERRFNRWVSVLRNLNLVTTPHELLTVIRAIEDAKMLCITGRTYINNIPVFSCTRCEMTTTDQPDKSMRRVWPPSADWKMLTIKPMIIPMKLRKYTWMLLLCPTHAKLADELIQKAEEGNATAPVQD
jgi:hypothetical protein